MNYGTTCGVLKPLDEVTLPDSRFEHEHLFVMRHDPGPWQLADLHKRLSSWPPASFVPEKVRVQIETARNLMLYTWFVFEFQTVAEMQAYAALELALRERLGNPMRQIVKKKKIKVVPLMLSELLAKALSDGLIVPERLPSFEWVKYQREWFAKFYGHPHESITSADWFNYVKSRLPNSRNHLAHGNVKLWWTESFSQVELCVDIINALFSDSKTS
jgi:hypothetical protein